MNTLFILFFCLLSYSSHSREYKQIYGTCSIVTTESDMFNKEERLPFYLNFDFVLSIDKKSKKLVGQKVIARPMINTTTAVDEETIYKLKSLFKFNFARRRLWVNFNASEKQISNLLLYTGAYRSDGLDFKAIKSSAKLGEKKRIQRHQPSHIEDGVSYHIEFECFQNHNRAHIRGNYYTVKECLVWVITPGNKKCGLYKK